MDLFLMCGKFRIERATTVIAFDVGVIRIVVFVVIVFFLLLFFMFILIVFVDDFI